jgi:hypothetical protein
MKYSALGQRLERQMIRKPAPKKRRGLNYYDCPEGYTAIFSLFAVIPEAFCNRH